MDFDRTIKELEQERDLITLAITAVETARDNRGTHAGSNYFAKHPRNRTTTVPGKRRHLTAAAKKLISDKMKAKWAARKAAAATGKKPVLVGRKKAA